MEKKISEQEEFEALDKEYQTYIKPLRADWLRRNQVNSRNVYEVMSPAEQAKVEEKKSELSRYITPLSEAWWKERGWGVLWPDDDSKPMQVFKLETAT